MCVSPAISFMLSPLCEVLDDTVDWTIHKFGVPNPFNITDRIFNLLSSIYINEYHKRIVGTW